MFCTMFYVVNLASRLGVDKNKTAVLSRCHSTLDKVLQDLLLQVLVWRSCRAVIYPLPFAEPDQIVASLCKTLSRLSPKLIMGEVCLAALWSIGSMLWSGAAKLNCNALMQAYLMLRAGAIHPCNVHHWLTIYIDLYKVCWHVTMNLGQIMNCHGE